MADPQAALPSEVRERNLAKVPPGREIRKASLYTEFTIQGQTFVVQAAGARSCDPTDLVFSQARNTIVYNLTCDLTFFHTDNSPVGPVTIIDDPRRQIVGSILLTRSREGNFDLPGLSYFDQFLIFHVGDRFFYYPSPWQVVSALTAWPPEYHQYHHLEDDTPIFDFNTREPNVARKGISTISIEGPLTDKEERSIRDAHAAEVKVIQAQPGYKIPPERFLDISNK